MISDIEKALQEVEDLVVKNGLEGDIQYFEYHRKRYLRMAKTVTSLCDKGAKILDIGSHYLHSSILLKKLGYDVYGMDVSQFWSIDFVKERGAEFGIKPLIQDDLQHLSARDLDEGSYDLIVFAEILEHITFNPVDFWKEVHKLLNNDGIIYISTPNSLSAQGMLSGLKNLLTFKGIGNSLDMIFSRVTYGHHWKEYSYRELMKYHKMLNDDFSTKVRFYSYQPFDNKSSVRFFWSIVRAVGNFTYIFSSDLEAIVRVNKQAGNMWKIDTPTY
jgi:2-polyprenyl-3-methyl-5-hydroxy-6-metoxy-1,4-benzoquinol methylase